MSITTERRALDRVAGGPNLRRREAWRSARAYTDARSVEPDRYQFVHISTTRPRNYASNDAHARAIEAIGIARFPATGVSYSRGVAPDGTPFELQPWDRRGAHTVNDKGLARCATSGCPSRSGSLSSPGGNLNYNARAYVIMQDVGDAVSAEQLDSLARVMAKDRLAGLIALDAPIHGHRCVAFKSCPGDRMWALMARLAELVRHYVRVGFGGTPQEDDMSAENAYVGFAQALADGAQPKDGPTGKNGRNIRDNLRAILVPSVVESVWEAEVGPDSNRRPLSHVLVGAEAKAAGALAAVEALAKQQGVDPAVIRKAVEDGVEEALVNLEVRFVVDDNE